MSLLVVPSVLTAECEIRIAELERDIAALRYQLLRDRQAAEVRRWRSRMRRWQLAHDRRRREDIRLWREQRSRGWAFALTWALVLTVIERLN